MANASKRLRWLGALVAALWCWHAMLRAPAQVLVELEPLSPDAASEADGPNELHPVLTTSVPAASSAGHARPSVADGFEPHTDPPHGPNQTHGADERLFDPQGQWLAAPGAWAGTDAPWIGPPPQRPALGRPLRQESWLLRPYHIGWLAGGMFADNPRDGDIDAGNGFVAGVRLGWDLSPYGGMETQVALTTHALTDVQHRELFSDSKTWFWSASTLVYPLGETQIRPFFIAGMGLADVNFNGSQTGRIHETLFTIPFGGGVKYRYNSRLAFRLDVIDTVIFSGSPRLDDMHHLSVTGAFEWHFGGRRRRTYWPWNPSRSWW